MSDRAWMTDALCATTAPDLFLPTRGDDRTNEAKGICAMCPVREICKTYAIENGLTVGIYGGLSPSERRQLKRSAA